MAEYRGDDEEVARAVRHKVSLHGWHCSRCGKTGTFEINTKKGTSVAYFMRLVAESHRKAIQESAIAIPCRAEPGHVNCSFPHDSEGRIWCGEFVIGSKGRPWIRALRSKVFTLTEPV